jgi:flagellar motility protein MotE (MotC chaperone)
MIKGFRIFPAVALAAGLLLAVKGLSWMRADAPASKTAEMREDGVPAFGRALTKARMNQPLDPDYTGSVPKKDEKKDADKKGQDKKDAEKKDQSKPDMVAQAVPSANDPKKPASIAERAILERLVDRRGELENRSGELDTRDALLRAAEKKLDQRVGELKQVEDRLQAQMDSREQSAAQVLKNLVIMYEAMKPKDAAKVFDRLDHKVLIPVVTRMKPAKMAEVLAAMSPEAAERLTVALATRGDQAEKTATANELPRLDAGDIAAPAAAQAKPQRP